MAKSISTPAPHEQTKTEDFICDCELPVSNTPIPIFRHEGASDSDKLEILILQR